MEYTEKVLGGPVVENESFVALTTFPSQIIGGNPDRVGLVISNFGNSDLRLAPTSAGVVLGGITVPANGGSVSINIRDDFTLPSRTWFGAGATANTNLYVLEYVRFTLNPRP